MKSSKQPSQKKPTGKVETAPKSANSKAFYYSPEAKDQATPFRMAYERNDLPIRIDHGNTGPKLKWTKEVTTLDYDQYLPVFFEGLRETKFPYDFLAEQGANEMVDIRPDEVIHVLPYLIQPMKAALRSSNLKTMIKILKMLQKIAKAVPDGGETLVAYYRQLLPVLGQYKMKNKNLGDGIEYGQRKNENLADLIEETLNILEMNGGPDAFINIRYVIPLYESCTGNR